MLYLTFTLVVIVFGRGAAQISPEQNMTAHDCSRVLHIGNQYFVTCSVNFNIKDQRANFELEYKDTGAQDIPLTGVALSCVWNGDQAHSPHCSGYAGYSLKSLISGSVTFEVPSNDIESKSYNCKVNETAHPPCNATSTTCPPLPSQTSPNITPHHTPHHITSATSTSTETPPKVESNDNTITGTHITVMVCVGLVVVGMVTAVVLVFILVFRRRAKSRKDGESGKGRKSSNLESQGLLMAERGYKKPDEDSSQPQIPGAIATSQRMTNPMTATPQRVFSVIPKTADDSREPWITSIVSTQHGKLVMTDFNNKKVKVVELNSPDTAVTASITLDEEPWGLALLYDSLVAVTTESKVYILRIDSEITVQSRVETERQYLGICANSDTTNTLMVGCVKDPKLPARVDIIDDSGHVLKTVININTDTRMPRPYYMCTVSSHVYISEWGANSVLKVKVETGRVVEELKHTDMESPRQVCVDQAGNVYIANEGRQCVLVRSGNGEWRRLLEARQHSEGLYVRPYGVCVTASGVVAVAWSPRYSAASLLTGHQLE